MAEYMTNVYIYIQTHEYSCIYIVQWIYISLLYHFAWATIETGCKSIHVLVEEEDEHAFYNTILEDTFYSLVNLLKYHVWVLHQADKVAECTLCTHIFATVYG